MNSRPLRALLMLLAVTACASGCASTGPDRSEVTDRFRLEIANSLDVGVSEDLRAPAETMTTAAFEGLCGDESFRAQIGHPTAQSAWDAGCLMYFEDDMSKEQVDRALSNMIAD